MTLLCEITDWTAESKFLNALEGASKLVVPLIYGHQLYSFLYNFLSRNEIEIKYIEIIKPNDSEVHQLFKSELKNYSVEFEDSEYAWDIVHWFPSQFQLEDISLKNKISSMIKHAKFIEPDSINDDDYLCYLPLSGETLNDIIINTEIDLTIFTNGDLSGLKEKRFIKLDQSEIRSISNKLKLLNENCKKIFSERSIEARNYHAPKYLTNFEGSFYENLKMIEYDDRTNKLHFVGSDNYTAKEGIEYLLKNKNFREYNLEQPIERLPSSDQSYVFTNFHSTFSQNKQHDLKEIITEHKLNDHVVIQGDNIKPIDYFDKYEKIPVPDEIEIKEIISGIFVSLVIGYNKYRAYGRDWVFYPIVKHNLLSEMLADSLNPEALSKTLREYNVITKEDLTNNLSFWIVFLNKYKHNYKELNKNKIVPKETKLERWHIIITNKKYKVISDLKVYDNLKINAPFLYLLFLIKFTECKGIPMSAENMRKAMIIWKGKTLPDYIDSVDAAGTLRKSFHVGRKITWFNKFTTHYVDSKKEKYTFNINKLNLEISGFDLDPHFFDAFKTSL